MFWTRTVVNKRFVCNYILVLLIGIYSTLWVRLNDPRISGSY